MNTQRTHRILSPQSSVMAEHPGRAGMLLDQLFNLRQVVLLNRISLRPALAFGQDGFVLDIGEALDIETSCTLHVVGRLGSNIVYGHDNVEFLAGWYGIHCAVSDGSAVVWNPKSVLGHDRLRERSANGSHDVGWLVCRLVVVAQPLAVCSYLEIQGWVMGIQSAT